MIYRVQIKAKMRQGPLSKILLKGQGSTTSVSLLNTAANTLQVIRGSILTSTTILTTYNTPYNTTYLLLSRLIRLRSDL